MAKGKGKMVNDRDHENYNQAINNHGIFHQTIALARTKVSSQTLRIFVLIIRKYGLWT